MTEKNPLWVPIKPKALWKTNSEITRAYLQAEPVKLARSQRYGLVLTEPEEK